MLRSSILLAALAVAASGCVESAPADRREAPTPTRDAADGVAAAPLPELADSKPVVEPPAPRPRIEGQQACRDDVTACVRTAVTLTRTDLSRAALLFEVACQESDPAGCGNWAVMLRDGRGIAQDRPRAALLMKRACDDGHAPSCDNARALDR